MSRLTVLLSVLLALPALGEPRRPNVIFILADDLGYGDVGVFYQNSRQGSGKPAFTTPQLDALAAGGLMMRQHYTACPVCAPARGSLLLGQSQGNCAIRDNEFDKPIPPDTLTLGSMMREAGYHTAVIGKWGLGGKPASGYPGHPMKRGFDEFFGFMLHATGHTYYHDAKHPLMDGLQDVGAKYEDVYSTDLFTARTKKFLKEQHEQHADRPFFLYLAYTAVHNALDVPGGPYPANGVSWPVPNAPAASKNKWIEPDYANKPWTEPAKRYATMARRLDDGVGDVMKTLKDLGMDQDTLVIFTSDNGPANEGGSDPRLFDSWGPFDGFKRDVFEGGVREPTIVYWPGHVAPKTISDFPSIFYDWMPTLAEVAGLPAPAQSDGLSLTPTLFGKGTQKAHPFLYVEYFYKGPQQATSKDVFARKHTTGRGQQQVIRIGDYVGVRVQMEKAKDELRLYDAVNDPHEDHDLASDPSHAALLKQMYETLVSARIPEADAPRPYDEALMPAVEANGAKARGLKIAQFEGQWPWTPDFSTLTPTSTGESAGIQLPASAPQKPFGLEFTGFLTVPEDGAYTLSGAAEGGLHVWVHDADVISADHCAAGKPESGTVHLCKGLHPIRVAYSHNSGAPSLGLKIAEGKGEAKAITGDMLSH